MFLKKPIIGLVTFLAAAAAGAAVAYAINKRVKNVDDNDADDYIIEDLESVLVDEVDTVEQPPIYSPSKTVVDADMGEVLESSSEDVNVSISEDQSDDKEEQI